MKHKKIVCLFGLMSCLSFQLDVNAQRELSFNDNWHFHLGTLCNAETVDYDDSNWRILNLPHDWSIEPVEMQVDGLTIGPFSKLSETRYPSNKQMGGGAWDVGATMGGEGWYRKSFTLGNEDINKTITLYIEAASYESEVWINGTKVYYNHYAYTPYRINITKYLNKIGEKNIIAIKVVNSGHNSRWYVGSGLYRNVSIIKTEQTHLDKWETYITTKDIKNKAAIIKFGTLIKHEIEGKGNLPDENKNLSVLLKILSPSGSEVCNETFAIEANDSVNGNIQIDKPQLWSVQSPSLYKANISLCDKGKVVDQIEIPFGIRTVDISANEGFLLNGKKMLLKGCCIHHDNGLLGAAAIREADYHKVKLLKDNGFNAIRCSHNLASESFYRACDEIGMLVIHETFDQWLQGKRIDDYHKYFPKYHTDDLTVGIKRDRNHPSIIMWSIGNEIPDRADMAGVEIGKELGNTIRALVYKPYITMGMNDFWDRRDYKWGNDIERACSYLDVCGYNYMKHKYESDHEKYPQRIIFGSESYPKDLAKGWNLVEKHPYVIGDFVWTSIDYVGEAGLAHTLELGEKERGPQFMSWPWYNAWCGDIDLIGNKKPQSYYRDVIWNEKPITMGVHKPIKEGCHEDVNGWGWTDEFQSWNWEGLEGQPMSVNVYSRAEKVQLFLNGKLIGTEPTDKETYTANFILPYQPGELIAKNVNKKNETFTLKTSDKASRIILDTDKKEIMANNQDLAYINITVVDNEGNIVPDASIPLKINYNGDVKVIAGNGSYDDMRSFRSLTPLTFRGKALAIVQPNGVKGTVTVTVEAEGMNSETIQIKLQ